MTISDQDQEKQEKIYKSVKWRFEEMYRRAYPSIADFSNKDDFKFKSSRDGELWLEPTHFQMKKEDYDELFKVEGSVEIGLYFVMSSPSCFHPEGSRWIAKKIIELFYFNDYTDKQRLVFVTAWYNLINEYENYNWVEHFEHLEELIGKVKEAYGDKIELPEYVYLKGTD